MPVAAGDEQEAPGRVGSKPGYRKKIKVQRSNCWEFQSARTCQRYSRIRCLLSQTLSQGASPVSREALGNPLTLSRSVPENATSVSGIQRQRPMYVGVQSASIAHLAITRTRSSPQWATQGPVLSAEPAAGSLGLGTVSDAGAELSARASLVEGAQGRSRTCAAAM